MGGGLGPLGLRAGAGPTEPERGQQGAAWPHLPERWGDFAIKRNVLAPAGRRATQGEPGPLKDLATMLHRVEWLETRLRCKISKLIPHRMIEG